MFLEKPTSNIKLWEIFIFSTIHSWHHHTKYHPIFYIPLGDTFNKHVIWEGGGSRLKKRQKTTQEGGRAIKKVTSPTQISLYVEKRVHIPFLVTQYFVLGFSQSSSNISASNKKKTSKSLSVYLRELILLYIERKWFLMRNLATTLLFKPKLSGKFQRFNAIDGSIEMLENS